MSTSYAAFGKGTAYEHGYASTSQKHMEEHAIPEIYQPIADLHKHLSALGDNAKLRNWYMSSIRDLYKPDSPDLFGLVIPFITAYNISPADQLTIFQQLTNCPVSARAGLHATFTLLQPLIGTTDNRLKKRMQRTQDTIADAALKWFSESNSEDNQDYHTMLYVADRLSKLPIQSDIWPKTFRRELHRRLNTSTSWRGNTNTPAVFQGLTVLHSLLSMRKMSKADIQHYSSYNWKEVYDFATKNCPEIIEA